MGKQSVEEYEANKSYWRQIAVEHHLAEDEDGADSVTHVDFVSHNKCNDCNLTPEVKFQSGYGYDCYGGLWTCHAYSQNWEVLRNGYTGNQLLFVGNSHGWLDPFWLMKANKALNVNYTYEHMVYNSLGALIAEDENGDVQYFPSSRSVRTLDMDRVDEPQQNYSIDNGWTINSIY